jgi:argininosuccinate synthase
MKKKIVLAFSGGLDTSFCAGYLTKEKGYEVHTVLVNTGGFNQDELQAIEKKAYEYGAFRHTSIDAQEEYYEKCISYLIFGNVLRNRNYPVSVSSERTFQAIKVLDYAESNDIPVIAHGSTGAGNDQVRFESVAMILQPDTLVLAPIRELSITREQEIAWLKENDYGYNAGKARYSINKGLWGTSVGGMETLTSNQELPEEAFISPVHKTGTELISIEFSKGEPVALGNKKYESKVQLIKDLEVLASGYGIGRDIHVGETIIGIKGRVGFEAAAARILIDAHYHLEKNVLSKWQQYWKEQLGNWYGMFVHEAQFLEPSMRDIELFLESTQRTVNGKVNIRLRPYCFSVAGIESSNDLMNPDFAKYGEENPSWTGDDVKGFTRIMSNASKIYYNVNKDEMDAI